MKKSYMAVDQCHCKHPIELERCGWVHEQWLIDIYLFIIIYTSIYCMNAPIMINNVRTWSSKTRRNFVLKHTKILTNMALFIVAIRITISFVKIWIQTVTIQLEKHESCTKFMKIMHPSVMQWQAHSCLVDQSWTSHTHTHTHTQPTCTSSKKSEHSTNFH